MPWRSGIPACAGEFWISCRRCIWVRLRLRKRELQKSSFEWTMEVAMVEAVLKSSMGRMRRRSRMYIKHERERLKMKLLLLVRLLWVCHNFSVIFFPLIVVHRLIHCGQFLNGMAGPVTTAGPPLLSSTWFPANQRTTATSLALLASGFGVATSYIIGSAWIFWQILYVF